MDRFCPPKTPDPLAFYRVRGIRGGAREYASLLLAGTKLGSGDRATESSIATHREQVCSRLRRSRAPCPAVCALPEEFEEAIFFDGGAGGGEEALVVSEVVVG